MLTETETLQVSDAGFADAGKGYGAYFYKNTELQHLQTFQKLENMNCVIYTKHKITFFLDFICFGFKVFQHFESILVFLVYFVQ